MKRTLIASAVAAGLFTLPGLSIANSFVADSKIDLSLRNFFINQDQRSGNPGYSKAEEWGQGFLLDARSGYTPGVVGFGVDLLGQLGVRLDGGGRSGKTGISRNPGIMFPLDDDQAASNFSRLDVAAKARISETELKLGVLQPSLPVLTPNDGRLLPQTFRGAHLTSDEVSGLILHLGEIARASGRASTDYEHLRINGGSERVNQFRFAGAEYVFAENLTSSYFFAELEDYYRQHFLGAEHTVELGIGKLVTDLRYFNSSSVGANDDRVGGYASRGYFDGGATSGRVDNQARSALFTYSVEGHALGLGYQHLSGDSDFPFINNGDGSTAYLITDSQIGKFLRAGEKTWVAKYSYDFGQVGVPGLKASGAYLRGSDIDAAERGADQEWERDLRLDYKVQSGAFKNVGVSLRHASLRSKVSNQRDVDEARVILSYTIALK
ncbi:OprD family porin [Pseudomonas saliphila]|uniref:OprD family porin n=1 Tax=Pseudomonas saliphila TaxID=2586906 RepID=UPI00123B8BD2|nr:OprD family porin [Pseudomonas saliphila]